MEPNGKPNESFGVFCPCDKLQHLDLLAQEDVLIDWTNPIYLNFTHSKILMKIEEFYSSIGTIEKVYGEVYGLSESLEEENINIYKLHDFPSIIIDVNLFSINMWIFANRIMYYQECLYSIASTSSRTNTPRLFKKRSETRDLVIIRRNYPGTGLLKMVLVALLDDPG
ncbi:hypothetical protein NQ317_017089 [Molorchus minor]|uniref:Uncharacterized protein n=1 Tax=Molorchus minor TaxID=1323400 RepID=A0ABQ9K622_9CUCU|nr:hypothetical protein NQ317_017089 [Molorchus minor]